MPQNLFKILVPTFLPKTLTYENSKNLQLSVGNFVKVQLGSKEVIGVILEKQENKPSLEPSQAALQCEASEKQGALKNSTLKPTKQFSLTKQSVEGSIKQNHIKKIKPILAKEDTKPLNSNLIKFINWVATYTLTPAGMILKMSMSGYIEPKDVNHDKALKLSSTKSDFNNLTEKQSSVINLLKDGDVLTKKQIKDSLGVGDSVVKNLIDKNYLQETILHYKISEIKPLEIDLSEDQKQAVKHIENKIDKGKFSATLIDGVTGSGKTEVYFSVIEKLLRENKDSQILIMLPEIALTSQIIDRFKQRFGFDPVSWHSKITKNKRQKNWDNIINGRARIVIGARSALFLPFANLQLIIVDEEHDSSYKQEEVVIYNARDMSVVRGKIDNIPIILASATPSLETTYNVEQGKYDIVRLKSRFGKAVMPNIKLIDMRKEKLRSDKWLSKELTKQISDCLDNKKQTLLFLNRKGYAPLTLCRECGHRFECSNCSAWLVEHRSKSKLICHHCGHEEKKPDSCPECGAEDSLAACGPGIERIEEEVSQIFPDAKIAIISGNEMGSMSQTSKLISDIETGEIDIIIGTQVIAKGYNFPKLELVGIIDADVGLEGGDLRASEQTYQLLQQVAGRAGRVKDQGLVLIQSYMPENSVIQSLQIGDRDNFIANEVMARRETQMPPFSKMVGIIISDKNPKTALDIARVLASNAVNDNNITILGPVEAPMFKIRNNFRYRILIKSENNINIQKWIQNLTASIKKPSSTMIKVDVDPYSFY